MPTEPWLCWLHPVTLYFFVPSQPRVSGVNLGSHSSEGGRMGISFTQNVNYILLKKPMPLGGLGNKTMYHVVTASVLLLGQEEDRL